MNKKLEKQEVKTTGHEWDGIEEYNNPLPRWWLWTFVICIIWALGYVVLYPAIPMGKDFSKGTLGWNQYNNLDKKIAEADEAKQSFNDQISASSVQEIIDNPELHPFAVAGGKAAFALHCSQCHGSNANGAKGYPSLLDDEWLWGGEIADIVQTITHGIRYYDDPETRDSAMMAYGDMEMLSEKEILDVIHYIQTVALAAKETASSERGKVVFADNCASCHGANLGGGQEFGAPALNNDIWLYGSSEEVLKETLYKGRAGQMPAFGSRLDENTIKKLAVFVHSLSGGQE